ncbi:MAG: MBL fold metallo-hydrolase [Firmicutes bacterium]|nr:MBL fold metallo-hydrolase [Bacillota bacterium]
MFRLKTRAALVWALVVLCITPLSLASTLRVHFIDVGQADAILIQTPAGLNILIDAGEKRTATDLMDYLKEQGVKRLDYLIATHPHADHIGGMAEVIKSFDIANIYMPRVAHTTKTYEDLLLTIRDKGLRIHEAKAGVVLDLGEGIEARLVAPASDGYRSLNDYSAVLWLGYGRTRFLFSGDAERISESEMLASGFDLSADVLKVGHHGSNTSTTESFLRAVSPTYGVIMVGRNNRYNLPHPDVLKRLTNAGVTILRTDKHGTIVFSSDGNVLELQVERPGQVQLLTDWEWLGWAA